MTKSVFTSNVKQKVSFEKKIYQFERFL